MPSPARRIGVLQGIVLGLLVALVAGVLYTQILSTNNERGPSMSERIEKTYLERQGHGNLQAVHLGGEASGSRHPQGASGDSSVVVADCPPPKQVPAPLVAINAINHVVLKGAAASVQQCEGKVEHFGCQMCVTSGAQVHRAVLNIPGPPALVRIPYSGYQTFMMATLAPNMDEVARVLHATRTVGFRQRMLLEKLFHETDGDCIDPSTGEPRLMVDLGANHGYYGLTAAMRGCEVIMVEPQPHLVAMIRSSIAINGLEDRARVIHAAVGGDKRTTATMDVQGSHSGIRHLKLGGDGAESEPGNAEKVTVDVLPLKQIVECALKLSGSSTGRHKSIYLMKIDVEGFEGTVLESQTAKEMFSNAQVQNLHLEFKNPKIISTLLNYNKDLHWGFYCETYADDARATRAILDKPPRVEMELSTRVAGRERTCEDVWISLKKHDVLYANKIWHRKKYRGIPDSA